MINTENAHIELRKKWTYHCRRHCIEKTTTEFHSTWKNTVDPKIGKLGSMVRNVMSAFDVPPKEHYWAHTCCVDVQNIASSKNINGRYPLEMSEGNTRTFQESDLIWGSLFDMLISVRLHKTIGNQQYRWGFYTPLEMKYDSTLRQRRKIQSTSSYQLYGLDAGTLEHTRSHQRRTK